MSRTSDTILPRYADDGTVVRELHDIPPYRVYEVRLEGRRAVLKIDDHPRGHAADVGRVHEYVGTHTSAPVPSVLAVGDDHYLTAWHDGFEGASATTDTAWARAAGCWLATVHTDTTGDFDGYGRPRDAPSGLELEANDDWIDAVRERIAHHCSFLDPFGYADIGTAVDRFLDAHPHVFDGAGPPVLCHGDVHPEHLTHVEDEATAAIDFEHALVAPAEYDYWRTVQPYLDAPDDVSNAVTRAFQDGYETVRPLPDGLERRRPAYRLLNLVAFLESLHLQRTVAPGRRTAVSDRLREAVFETLETLQTR